MKRFPSVDDISPKQFEQLVKDWIESGAGSLDKFTANHLESVTGFDLCIGNTNRSLHGLGKKCRGGFGVGERNIVLLVPSCHTGDRLVGRMSAIDFMGASPSLVCSTGRLMC